MTRTHKANEIPHNHPEAKQYFEENMIPKYFGKAGPVNAAPNKIKKNGAGKCNWGPPGEEVEDLMPDLHVFHARRRSNSVGHTEDRVLRSKFETFDEEPVFEEDLHGPGVEEGAELASTISNVSDASNGSVQGEKA
ncbi:hypothetical protein RUND412_005599 [Rhizina undulata]